MAMHRARMEQKAAWGEGGRMLGAPAEARGCNPSSASSAARTALPRHEHIHLVRRFAGGATDAIVHALSSTPPVAEPYHGCLIARGCRSCRASVRAVRARGERARSRKIIPAILAKPAPQQESFYGKTSANSGSLTPSIEFAEVLVHQICLPLCLALVVRAHNIT